MIRFQDNAIRRESEASRRMYMMLISTLEENSVRRTSGVFAITRKSHCVPLATESQLVPGLVTRRGVFVKCSRDC